MNASPRTWLTVAASLFVFMTMAGAACVGPAADDGRPLPPSPAAASTPAPSVVVAEPDAGAPPPGPAEGGEAGSTGGGYEAMCRHYCGALQETDTLVCAAVDGGDPQGCTAQRADTADRCFDLRCRPALVQQSLCFTQCDALARLYDARCATAGAADPLCPSSPAEHDAACRAGCAL